jgi:glutathione S-transferase
MKLFYAAGLPHARIARIALRETGLDRRVEEVEVTLRRQMGHPCPINQATDGGL